VKKDIGESLRIFTNICITGCIIILIWVIITDIKETRCYRKEERIFKRMQAIVNWPEPQHTRAMELYLEQYEIIKKQCGWNDELIKELP
jgi:hypothetical protein